MNRSGNTTGESQFLGGDMKELIESIDSYLSLHLEYKLICGLFQKMALTVINVL